MSAPLVSVVVPVFEGERFIAETIRSVLAQTHDAVDVVVVDDGSTDGSADAARSFPGVRVFREPHAGLPTALNAGLAAATGELVAFIDADDLWPPDRLRILVEHLEAHSELGFVCGRLSTFPDGAYPIAAGTAAAPTTDRAALSLGCMLVRADVLRDIGSFAADLQHSHDIDWVNRAKEAGVRWEILPTLVLHKRMHPWSETSRNPQARRSDFLRAIKRAMDRRRATGTGSA